MPNCMRHKNGSSHLCYLSEIVFRSGGAFHTELSSKRMRNRSKSGDSSRKLLDLF